MPVLMDERKLPQCPTGYLKSKAGQQALAWVDEYYRMKSVCKASNSPYFRSVDEADPRIVSAFTLIESESTYIEAEIKSHIASRPVR